MKLFIWRDVAGHYGDTPSVAFAYAENLEKAIDQIKEDLKIFGWEDTYMEDILKVEPGIFDNIPVGYFFEGGDKRSFHDIHRNNPPHVGEKEK